MKKTKPFEMTNASYIPNQLFDTRCKFITNQQRIFLIYLYRKLYGYGETEKVLSYSVIFNDFPCIIKNKQKFSNMIKDLETKGLIKIKRGNKKSHTYIIEEEQYNNLVFWSVNNKDSIIEPPEEITENETENNTENEPKEKTLFEEIIECEKQQYSFQNRYTKRRDIFIEPIPTETTNEKMYLYQLTENEFKDSYPDMNIACHSMYRNQTIENFNKTAESIRERRKQQQENQMPAETDTPTDEEINESLKNITY